MKTATATQRAYVNKKSEATLTCPNCKRTHLVSFAHYKDLQERVRAKCSCGCQFTVENITLESRKFYRKQTKLPGSYSKADMSKSGIIRVINLSFSGLQFRTDKEHDLEVKDIIGIKFILEDGKKTELRRTAVVKNVRGQKIGAEFCDSQIFDLDLCYFLMLN
ncbi:MAG: PilZ domain-containing protein [Candidatus Tectomicrobia bacterium]